MVQRSRHTYTLSPIYINSIIITAGLIYLKYAFNFITLGIILDASTDTINGLCNILAHQYIQYHRFISYLQTILYIVAGSFLIIHNLTHMHWIDIIQPLYFFIFIFFTILGKGIILYKTHNLLPEVSMQVIRWDATWDILLELILIIIVLSLIFGYDIRYLDFYTGILIGIIMMLQGLVFAFRIQKNNRI